MHVNHFIYPPERCWNGACAHLQQLHVDQLLWTRRSFHEVFAQDGALHLPLLLEAELKETKRKIESFPEITWAMLERHFHLLSFIPPSYDSYDSYDMQELL